MSKHMCSIRSVPENNDYLLVDVKFGIGSFLGYDLENDVYTELQNIYFKLFQYEHEESVFYSGDIALRKDSIVGNYLINHPEVCRNEDEEITFEKVTSAYCIATYEENNIIANRILPYFRNRVTGNKYELETKVNKPVLEYILKNNDFNEYIKNIDNNESNTEYLVYEDGKYSKKVLGPRLVVVKHKN